MRVLRKGLASCGMCAALLILAGCQGYSITGGPGKTVAPSLMTDNHARAELLHINSIAVLPPFYDVNARIALSKSAAIYDNLDKVMRGNLLLEVSAREMVASASKEARYPTAPTTLRGEQLSNLGHRLGVDALLVVTINRFRERLGSSVGAEIPAQVDFIATLYRASDGSELWKGSYHREDEAVSDNLFRLGRGSGRWHTAEQLLDDGFIEAARSINAGRADAFVSAPLPPYRSTRENAHRTAMP